MRTGVWADRTSLLTTGNRLNDRVIQLVFVVGVLSDVDDQVASGIRQFDDIVRSDFVDN